MRLIEEGLRAVEPERLTREALSATEGPASVVAIGKAAAGMCRGAADIVANLGGICVTNNTLESVPAGIQMVIGDHPIPGDSSFAAGQRALEVAAAARHRLIALISGGGSALCEHPLKGIPAQFIREINTRLFESGASIQEINLVRRHLSALKNGGLARSAPTPVDTYVISDVCGADLSVVASGPTVARPRDPDAAIAVMTGYGIEVPEAISEAIRSTPDYPGTKGRVVSIADGHTARDAVVEAATRNGLQAKELPGWLEGRIEDALDWFFEHAGPGITVAAGEPEVTVTGGGSGGRNTHAGLMAAARISGTDAVFSAFATDGIDGNTQSAGAIVDGYTLERGGSPGPALEHCDSATYLERSGDLVITGPTGTNVSDLWILCR